MITDFLLYWKETNAKGKERWELEKTWDVSLRLKRWKRMNDDRDFKESQRRQFIKTSDEDLSTKHKRSDVKVDGGFEPIIFGKKVWPSELESKN